MNDADYLDYIYNIYCETNFFFSKYSSELDIVIMDEYNNFSKISNNVYLLFYYKNKEVMVHRYYD